MARKCLDRPQLTEISGLSETTIKNAIKGNDILLSSVGKIAKALEVDVTELIEQED
ncbi:helix-turn-helix domain-containing protein [Fusobacterium varium]|nr:helix-turn-helix domain-containing protein [Fusobacterium varium]